MSNERSLLAENLLILVPTAMELEFIAHDLSPRLRRALCGFGPIAAGVETAWLLGEARHQGIRRLVLIGSAGTWDPERLPPGTAASFRRVECDGVGAGQGKAHQSAAKIGFPQAAAVQPAGDGDALGLMPLAGGPVAECLVTVTAASGSSADVDMRRPRFPDATCEDMEGYGVALAAARFGIPLTIIRGMANAAGQRDRAKWRMAEAMNAACRLLLGNLA